VYENPTKLMIGIAPAAHAVRAFFMPVPPSSVVKSGKETRFQLALE
jgi:hypothetical protein